MRHPGPIVLVDLVGSDHHHGTNRRLLSNGFKDQIYDIFKTLPLNGQPPERGQLQQADCGASDKKPELRDIATRFVANSSISVGLTPVLRTASIAVFKLRSE